MNLDLPRETWWFLGGLGGVLAAASAGGGVLALTVRDPARRAAVAGFNSRTIAWWWMSAIVVASGLCGGAVPVALFALLSFLALREFVTLAPTRRGDHRTLFWLFFVAIPVQYALVHDRWYGLFAVFIPVWVLLFIAARSVGAGDTRDYLARVARIHIGVMLCVYFVSHVPMLLTFGFASGPGRGLDLMLYLIAVVQVSDVLQGIWGRLCGRHPVAPTVDPGRTWEGFLGGGLCAVGVGTGLWWMTPLSPLRSAGLSAVIVLCGSIGGLVLAAIKRDAGVKDWGHLVPGHRGILDRIGSLAFAAPAFLHLLRYLGGG